MAKLTERGLELIKTDLPKDPCTTCPSRLLGECTCTNADNYKKIISEYMKEGVYNLALDYQKREAFKKHLDVCYDIIKSTESKLPAEVLATENPFRCSLYQKELRKSNRLSYEEFPMSMSTDGTMFVRLQDINDMISRGILIVDYDKLEENLLERNND
jgi:hypothetical protein